MESWTFLAFFITSAVTLAMAVTALAFDRRG